MRAAPARSSSSPSPPCWRRPGTALGHAVLVSSSPAADARLAAAPEQVTLTFSEPVEVRAERGHRRRRRRGQRRHARARRPTTRQARGGRDPAAPRARATAPTRCATQVALLRLPRHPGRVRVRRRAGRARPAVPRGRRTTGPSETGPWGVSSRFLEMVGLGGLIGLLAFRWLVWGPAVRGRAARAGPRGGARLGPRRLLGGLRRARGRGHAGRGLPAGRAERERARHRRRSTRSATRPASARCSGTPASARWSSCAAPCCSRSSPSGRSGSSASTATRGRPGRRRRPARASARC